MDEQILDLCLAHQIVGQPRPWRELEQVPYVGIAEVGIDQQRGVVHLQQRRLHVVAADRALSQGPVRGLGQRPVDHLQAGPHRLFAVGPQKGVLPLPARPLQPVGEALPLPLQTLTNPIQAFGFHARAPFFRLNEG